MYSAVHSAALNKSFCAIDDCALAKCKWDNWVGFREYTESVFDSMTNIRGVLKEEGQE